MSIILSAEYSDSMSSISAHYHDCHQLLYIKQGQICITVSDKLYHAVPGTLVLISRFEQHAIEVKSTVYQRYCLQIAPEAVVSDPLFSLLVNRPAHFYHAVALAPETGAEHLLLQLLQEQEGQKPMRSKMQQLILQQLLILVYRAQPEMSRQEENELMLIRRIQQKFESEPAQSYTLLGLSRQYHISPSHLSHLFKKVTGSSVMGYLASCRFAAAKGYLAQTEIPIGTIVELCGFTDGSNFSRSFKAAAGMSPSQFRAQFREHHTDG